MPSPIDESTIITRNLTTGVVRVQQQGDTSSYIEFDPNTSTPGIFAYGNSRTKGIVELEQSRTYGIGSNSLIGLNINAYQIGAATDAGFYTNYRRTPFGLDLTMPVDVYILIDSADAALQSGGVFTEAKLTSVDLDDHTISEYLVQYKFNVVNWQMGHPYLVLIDNGDGYTFDPGSVVANGAFGLKCSLIRSAASDTFPSSVNLARSCTVVYTRKSY